MFLDLDILTLQTGWQTLSQLISLLRIFHTKSVQVLGTTDLELGTSRTLTDLNHLGILATGLLEEVANIGDLLGHGLKKKVTKAVVVEMNVQEWLGNCKWTTMKREREREEKKSPSVYVCGWVAKHHLVQT